MTVYSIETHAGIWHANFPSVAHLHWKKGKRWEAFWNLLKNWAQGDEFLSLGPRYNWFSAQWRTGVTFNTPSRWRTEMYPKVQLLRQISTKSALPPRKALCPGRVRGWSFTQWWERADGFTCSLAFGFSVARSQKRLLSSLHPKVRGEHRADPPWNTY